MNNNDREEWVDNNEGWYLAFRRSKLSMRAFLKENREAIDEDIKRKTKQK